MRLKILINVMLKSYGKIHITIKYSVKNIWLNTYALMHFRGFAMFINVLL